MRKIVRTIGVLLCLVCCMSFWVTSVSAETVLEVHPLKLEYNLRPGQQAGKTIVITNKGTVALHINPEILAYRVNPKGVPILEMPGNNELSAVNWLKVDRKAFDLFPGESREVKVEVIVPATAEKGGHYVAVAFNTGNAANSNSDQVKVGIAGRIAVVNLITVPGKVDRNAALVKFNVPFFNSGYPVPLELTLSDRGNIHAKLDGVITIKNWLTSKAESIIIPETIVFPNSTKKLNINFDSGMLVGVFSANVHFNDKSIQDLTQPVTFILFPWTTAGGLGLLLIGIYLLGLRKGRQVTVNVESKMNRQSA